MYIRMRFSDWVRRKHEEKNARAWAFVNGFCFAVLCYCVVYTYFYYLK